MKILLLTFISFSAFSQCPEDLWKRAVPITDTRMEVQMGKGQAVIVLLFERNDTTQTETWVITKKGNTPTPEPVEPKKIEAESATSLVNCAIVNTIIGNMRGDLGGVVIKYPAVEGRTKVRFRYSRGYPGNGTMVMKIGTTSNTLSFPSTGGWGDYKEIEFTVSGSGAIELTSGEIGPANIDHFTML